MLTGLKVTPEEKKEYRKALSLKAELCREMIEEAAKRLKLELKDGFLQGTSTGFFHGFKHALRLPENERQKFLAALEDVE